MLRDDADVLQRHGVGEEGGCRPDGASTVDREPVAP
jgi:hypothetical protein